MHDAASNVSKAFEDDLGADLICVVHALNMAFKEAYSKCDELKELCDLAAELSSFFSHSSAARQIMIPTRLRNACRCPRHATSWRAAAAGLYISLQCLMWPLLRQQSPWSRGRMARTTTWRKSR